MVRFALGLEMRKLPEFRVVELWEMCTEITRYPHSSDFVRALKSSRHSPPFRVTGSLSLHLRAEYQTFTSYTGR